MSLPTCPLCGSEDGFRVTMRHEVACENPECMFEVSPDPEDLIPAAIATYQRNHAPRIEAQSAALIARADALKAQHERTTEAA